MYTRLVFFNCEHLLPLNHNATCQVKLYKSIYVSTIKFARILKQRVKLFTYNGGSWWEVGYICAVIPVLYYICLIMRCTFVSFH